MWNRHRRPYALICREVKGATSVVGVIVVLYGFVRLAVSPPGLVLCARDARDEHRVEIKHMKGVWWMPWH
jgi:hypothetical protein